MMAYMNNTWLGTAIRKGVILTALPFVLLLGILATGGDKMELTQENVKALFDYDSATGDLSWKDSTGKKSKTIYGVGPVGYKRFNLNGKVITVHRAVFVYHHGYLPKLVDHINGNKLDNRIENLRDASYTTNMFNRKKNANNRSGKMGVTFCNTNKIWKAQIGYKGTNYCLGSFVDLNDAIKARIAGEIKFYGAESRA